MTLEEYQKQSRKTARYPDIAGYSFVYPTLGLTGEAGEVADKLKKLIRDGDGSVPEEKRKEIEKELGDVLWYVAQIATELDISLNDVGEENIEKIMSRQDRGVIGGSGDNR